MKIHKVIILFIIMSLLCVVMAGCGKKEEKKNDNTDINNGIESKQEEVNEQDKSKVNNVVYNEVENEEHYIVINGYNKNFDSIWEYITQKEKPVKYSSIEFLQQYNNEIVYVNELGTIKALDFQTGNELWTNSEYQGGPSLKTCDSLGNLYLFSIQGGYKLFIVNPKGKTIKKLDLSEYQTEINTDPWCFEDMSLETRNNEAVKLNILYKIVNDEKVDGKTVSNITEKSMSIDLDSYNVEIKTIETNVEVY